MDKDTRIKIAVELFEKALRVNGLSDRKRDLTGDLPTVFVEFSGHVSSIVFRICEFGWSSGDAGSGFELPLDCSDNDFLTCSNAVSLILDETQKKAEEILTKAVAADA